MMWNDDYYSVLESEYGLEKTRLVADSHRESIDWVEKVCNSNFSPLFAILNPSG